MADVSSSHQPAASALSSEDERPHDVEREEIVDVTTEEYVHPAAHAVPSRDDEIDVTTISNSPNGSVMSAQPPLSRIVPSKTTTTATPSAMNLDNFIREDARLSALRKMQQSRAVDSAGDFRQATDHDYVTSTNRNGAGRFGSAALFRQSALPSAVYASGGSAARTEMTTVAAAPPAAVPASPSAIHRRKRKGASTDHAADSDSDDPDEELFRNAKIEYTMAHNPEDSNDFSCPRCPAQFESRVGLTNHLKLHGSDKQFPCTMCDFCCTNKKTMRQHRRIHGVVRRPGKQPVAQRPPPVRDEDEYAPDFGEEEEVGERSPEKQEIRVTPITTRTAKYASSSAGVRKLLPSMAVSATRQSLTRAAAQQALQILPKTRRNDEAAAVVPSKSVEEPPILNAISVDVAAEEAEQVAANQPIIRAIDFALKLNLDEHGNPLPLPARDTSAANQSFTLGGGVAPPTSISLQAVAASKSPVKTAKVAKRDEDEMPSLPQEMQHEETSDDDEPDDGQPTAGSPKNRVKCKDCPFTARTVAHLQPHLLGHARETGYKCQFCTFKSESLGFIKRHINIHNEAQFTWPPEYIGDSQEHMQKLLAKERKRLALGRRRKAEAQHNGGESSSTRPIDANDEAKDEDTAEEDAAPKRRGAKTPRLEPEEPTRRSMRTSRPPKPVYTAGERPVRRSQVSASEEATAPDATPKRGARKSASDATAVAAVEKPSGSAVAESPATSSAMAGGSKTSADFNQCKYCDYKVAARAPAAVMIRHVTRRHKAEEDSAKDT